MKRKKGKLVVKAETIRALSSDQLAGIAGGLLLPASVGTSCCAGRASSGCVSQTVPLCGYNPFSNACLPGGIGGGGDTGQPG